MATKRYGRDYVNRAFDRAEDKQATTAKRRKAGFVDAPRKIRTAPHVGDPVVTDWLACECGYQRPTSRGRPVPQYADPAWAGWSEGNSRSGKQSLHKAIRQLALEVYRVGYHHNVIALGTDPGYPDLTLWGPGRPGITVYREEKPMRPDWKPGQREHLLSLQEAGHDVAVWRPCCLLAGLIDDQLAALAGVAPKGRGALRLAGTLNRRITWQDVADGAINED